MNYKHLEQLFKKHKFYDFKWIKARNIVIKQWVRFKCLFMCNTYGTKSVCPPNMPTIKECEKFFLEYTDAAILRVEIETSSDEVSAILHDMDDRLMELEKEVFFLGYYKVMTFPATICYRCEKCSRNINTCNNKELSRPTPEALGVDLFETVKKVGYSIEVLSTNNQKMNRYAILMIE
ncbi:DUF2284 domain-containing protein [Natranaerobius trueperi]|uniref:Metal-binding protein n=1 Tax=Natranaerobius trueperi TaxID=759412 RepID=A0A226BYJ1_9FIRM|nr:DUF2284 domain-containing protein [Natranaerobius trueperi]OWZ83842.1 metal-binding protein [Natranaerobius trueperi]